MARYLVIGSGAAGIGAVEGIRTLDPTGQLVLLGEEGSGSPEQAYYSRPGLAYFLTGELPEKLLFPFENQDFQRLRVSFQKSRVTALHPDRHQVELDDGMKITYDKLLIATGARAAQAQVPGIEARGVVKLDCLDDALDIMRQARRDSRPTATLDQTCTGCGCWGRDHGTGDYRRFVSSRRESALFPAR